MFSKKPVDIKHTLIYVFSIRLSKIRWFWKALKLRRVCRLQAQFKNLSKGSFQMLNDNDLLEYSTATDYGFDYAYDDDYYDKSDDDFDDDFDDEDSLDDFENDDYLDEDFDDDEFDDFDDEDDDFGYDDEDDDLGYDDDFDE